MKERKLKVEEKIIWLTLAMDGGNQQDCGALGLGCAFHHGNKCSGDQAGL